MRQLMRMGTRRVVPVVHVAHGPQEPGGDQTLVWRHWLGLARSLGLALALVVALGLLTVDLPSLFNRLPVQPAVHAGVEVGRAQAQATLRAMDFVTPELAFSELDYFVDEGIGNAVVTVTLSTTTSRSISVNVSTNNFTASADEDYYGTRRIRVVEPGREFFTFTVMIIDDLIVEGDESLSVVLSVPQNATLGEEHEAFIHILDNDEASLSITDTVVAEDTGSAVLTLTQSTTSTLQTLVDVQTQDGSAQSSTDYSALFTTASIPQGSIRTTVTIPIIDDSVAEPDESFSVVLTDPLNAVLARAMATVKIVDDDALPQLSLAYTETNEAAGTMHFIADLDRAAAMTVTAAYTTQDGDAVAPMDYVAAAGVLTIPPGTQQGEIAVTLVDDELGEPDEMFSVILSEPQNAVLGQAQANGLILDDDAEPPRLFIPRLLR